MRVVSPAFALLCLSAASPALAGDYMLRVFDIPGATSVSVAGINDTGLAAGTFSSASVPYGGFVGRRGGVTTLPVLGPTDGSEPRLYVPSATGINNRGTVIGNYMVGTNYYGFLWRGGAYVAYFSQGEIYSSGAYAPVIGTGDHLSYNSYEGDGVSVPYAGTPAAQAPLNVNNFALVTSVNGYGAVAGQYGLFVGGTEVPAVFTLATGHADTAHIVLPPGATAAFGGWINDAKQIAGSYSDKAGVLHGFLYQNGSYTSFDLPTKPDTLTTQGIDNAGRVVGVFTKGKTQFAFIYAGGGVTRLRPFPLGDTVHVSISHFAKFIAISDVASSGVGRSWLAFCTSASGC